MRYILAAILHAWLIGVLPAQAAPNVVVTIKPLYGIAASVMEGVGSPELLIEGAISPHTFQFRPSQMQRLADADVVIWMGENVEMPLAESMAALPARVHVIEMATHPALVRLAYRTGGVWPSEADVEPAAAHAHEGALDPHLWLDPRNGILMARIMAEALSAADPEHAALYAANADALSARLSAIDAGIREQLAPFAGQPFIVFHDGFQYFEARYGLTAAGSIALDPERPPGPRTVMELRYEIMDRNISCVFSEPQFGMQLVETVVEGTAARAATLDPIGAQWPATAGVYEHLLQHLADDFVACMGG